MRRKPLFAAMTVLFAGACVAPEFRHQDSSFAPAFGASEAPVLLLEPTGGALTGAERANLASTPRRSTVDGLARVLVTAPPAAAGRARAVTQALEADGAIVAQATDPDATMIAVTALELSSPTTDCPDWTQARLSHPMDLYTPNPMPAHATALGCDTRVALMRMVARPDDLGNPPERMSPAPAAPAVRAVELYRTTGVPPLPERTRAVSVN
jgi:type IV pilus biogenesis protein CpaD/CtpE